MYVMLRPVAKAVLNHSKEKVIIDVIVRVCTALLCKNV